MNKLNCLENEPFKIYLTSISLKLLLKRTCFYLSIFLLLFPVNLASSSGFKQVETLLQDSTQINKDLPIKISSVPDPPPHREGRPNDTSSGGTRGRCLQDPDVSPELTLLIPDNQQGLTVVKHPTFFVFVPQTKAKRGEFILYDRTEEKLVYQTTFELSGLPGIVRIQLPVNQAYLKINNNYEWRFLLYCKSNDDRSEDVMKVGQIKRVAPNEAIAKIQGTPNSLEKARVYQKNKIWYDALQTVAELHPTTGRNSNAAAVWQELLQAEKGLKEIAPYPLIDCCKPTN